MNPEPFESMLIGVVGKDSVLNRVPASEAELALQDRQFAWIHVETATEGIDQAWLSSHLESCPLTLEDAQSRHIRSGIEQAASSLGFLVVAPMNTPPNSYGPVAFIVKPDLLVTYSASSVEVLRQEFHNWIREIDDLGSSVSDVLYNLLDSLVSSYFPALDRVHESIDEAENDALSASDFDPSIALHIKRELANLRKQIVVLRDNLILLSRSGAPILPIERTGPQINTEGHCERLLADIDIARDMAVTLIDVQLGVASNRMNRVMKTLTVVSTVLMVNSLIAGIYGMNFRFMPELEIRWGYPLALGLMLCSAICVVMVFKWRKYI